MCMPCFQLQKEIQEENKPLGFLYKIKNCSLMLKKTSTSRRLLQTEISNEESNCSSIKFWYRYQNWNCSKGRVNKKTWWNYCHTHNFISEKNLSSSIHVNKKCYEAETCLKFKILFQLLIRWFKDVYRYHLNKKLELFLLVNTFLRDITTAADWKFRAMSYS